MTSWQSLTASLPLGFLISLLSSLGGAAFATTLELTLLPTPDSPGGCPDLVVAHETPRPYREGGYARDGMIKLSAIATDIAVTASDGVSTTWAGRLKPDYGSCQGTAIITRIDGEPYSGHSYLRLRLADGQATVVLDMTGISDANGFTSTLLFGGLRDGNPRWTWGGTD